MVAFFPLTLPLWIADTVLLSIGAFFQLSTGRQNVGLSYNFVVHMTNAIEAESLPILEILKNFRIFDKDLRFFNAVPQPETILGRARMILPSFFFKGCTTALYGALGLKAGRLEHLQNQKTFPWAERLREEEMKKPEALRSKETLRYCKEAIEMREKYAKEDRPNPSLVYGLVDVPYQLVAAVTRAVERKFDAKKADQFRSVDF